MSGKPAPVVPWSLNGNFPAGSNPWNAQPLALPPAGTWFTPNTKPAAEEFNYLFGSLSANMQTLQDWAGNNSILNWSAAIVNTSIQSSSAILATKWDSSLRRWLAVLQDTSGGTLTVWGNWGLGGDAWSGAPSTATGAYSVPASVSVAHDGTNLGDVWLGVSDVLSGSQVNLIVHWNGSAWSNSHSPTASGGTQCQPEIVTVGTTTVAAMYSTLSTTTNGGSTWTDHTTAANLNAWFLRNATPGWIAVPANVAGTAYYTSPDGVTWTNQTFSIIGANDSVAGLTFGVDAAGSAWFLAVNNSSSVNSRIYRSPDGLVWTLVHTMAITCFGALTVQISELISQGSLLVAACTDASSGGPSIQIFSANGGISWWQVPNGFLAANASSYSRPRIHGSDVGLLVHNGEYIRFSQAMGIPTTLQF